ncbi:MAG TPA: thymidylate synthase (FAD), partial [Eggerthellaceae bacterium]|nr:thymidylate synthase (FAD) [Eggerthellaceae bacterium]
CCNRAQWEIRALAWRMLELVRPTAPFIFADAGPGCVRGSCPEGKMTCGNPYPRAEGRTS